MEQDLDDVDGQLASHFNKGLRLNVGADVQTRCTTRVNTASAASAIPAQELTPITSQGTQSQPPTLRQETTSRQEAIPWQEATPIQATTPWQEATTSSQHATSSQQTTPWQEATSSQQTTPWQEATSSQQTTPCQEASPRIYQKPPTELSAKLQKAQNEFARFLNKRKRLGGEFSGIQGFYVDEQPSFVPCLVIDADSSKQTEAEKIISEFLEAYDGISRSNIQILGQENSIKPALHGVGAQLNVDMVDGQPQNSAGRIGGVLYISPDGSPNIDQHWNTPSSVAVTCCHLFTRNPETFEGMLEGRISSVDIPIPLNVQGRVKGILGYHTKQPVEDPDDPHAAVDIALIKLENNNGLNVNQYEGYISSGKLHFEPLPVGDERRRVRLGHASSVGVGGEVFNNNYHAFNPYTMLYENELLAIHPVDRRSTFADTGDSGSFVLLETGRSMTVGIVTYVRPCASLRGGVTGVNQTFAAYLNNCIEIFKSAYHIQLGIPPDGPIGDSLEVEQLFL